MNRDSCVIVGRILPHREPYCQTSLLIRITLSPEYPFKAPDVAILDPIYHININEYGKHCCCCGFSCIINYKPTMPLAEMIEFVIHIIDNPEPNQSFNTECTFEYLNDYQTFHKKALKLTLKHKRPRY